MKLNPSARKRRILAILIFTIAFVTQTHGKANSYLWFDGTKPVIYSAPLEKSAVVSVALDMFKSDIQQVTGLVPVEADPEHAGVRIVQLDKNQELTSELEKQGVPVQELASRKDGFFIKVIKTRSGSQLLVVGNNGRGTAYGILELSRLAGVSPWVWWGDVTPFKQSRLSVSSDYSTFQSPSVEFRGIFLNDEDWSLQPWSWKHFEKSDIPGRIGPRTYKEIFKLLLRLRANAIWPGMHGMTTPFYLVPGAKEAADSCGIVIGTSHCEPLMRNNVGEWDVACRGDYNYVSNSDSVKAYWTERLKEVGTSENIYTIGMRGIHDSGMEGVKSLDEETETLQRVIEDQRQLLSEYVDTNVEQIPQQFVPYKEVLKVMDNGLKVPDDVILTWCDDNYGYMTRLSDKEQQKRSGGAGVYYHLQYWGRPHDYMWLSTTQPGLIYSEMKQAYDSNARRLWIVNVHDMKTAAYDMELFLDMAWDINSVTPSTLIKHQENWLCRELGETAGKKILPAMLEYYRLCGIRKPEFMGWTQVELSKAKYARGMSPVIDTEFSLTEFGGELDRYLEDYQRIQDIVSDAESDIAPERKDAFFAEVKYPLLSAAAMSIKMLEAQRARSIASGTYDAARWTREPALMEACAKSMNAYFDIRRLTDYYNNELAEGKWKYSMCYNPRDLYVFNPPGLPVGPTETEIEGYLPGKPYNTLSLAEVNQDNCIVFNACDYTNADNGVQPIQMLGHSMNAVSLPKNASITFEFDCQWDGEAELLTAVIPTQPNDEGDIRFSVQIDDDAAQVCSFKEGFRSESWKKNVMRGQAIRTTKQHLNKGKHRFTITALDDHVIVDQWMIDFKPGRKFYVFPVAPAYSTQK